MFENFELSKRNEVKIGMEPINKIFKALNLILKRDSSNFFQKCSSYSTFPLIIYKWRTLYLLLKYLIFLFYF